MSKTLTKQALFPARVWSQHPLQMACYRGFGDMVMRWLAGEKQQGSDGCPVLVLLVRPAGLQVNGPCHSVNRV